MPLKTSAPGGRQRPGHAHVGGDAWPPQDDACEGNRLRVGERKGGRKGRGEGGREEGRERRRWRGGEGK